MAGTARKAICYKAHISTQGRTRGNPPRAYTQKHTPHLSPPRGHVLEKPLNPGMDIELLFTPASVALWQDASRAPLRTIRGYLTYLDLEEQGLRVPNASASAVVASATPGYMRADVALVK